ncbi:Cytochrome P450 2B11 [Termitomyces sp. J132]|nr:Cytochrome P450 2B11 [Termitomyces sp. J132]
MYTLDNVVPSTVTACSIFFVALGIGYLWRSNSKAHHKLPPGPSRLPLLGNVLQVPGKHLTTYFRRMVEEYGGLVSLKLAGSTVILVGDLKLAKHLLEKHSAKHSSRPVLPYVRKYVDPENDFWALGEECESHSLGRKLTTGIMSLVRVGKTEPLQEYEAALNVQHLLGDGGKDWFHHIERVASSTVLTAAFGMHCPTGRELELKTFLDVLAEAIHLVTPNASIINKFPFVDLIPGPMPWRARAQSFRKRLDILYEKLLDDALTGKASGMNTEIDYVVGTDRLPTFKDRPLLPYVEAIVRVRAGAPHQSTADDVIEHQGEQYFIPKGSIIFAVTWAIEHDQSKFEDHERFMPERFLDSEGNLKPNYETSVYGFGRRLCPGIPFGERLLWINIVTMLWTFNIRASDEIDPKTALPFQYDDSNAAFNGDLAKSPLKFPAVFEPRSSLRAEVAMREWIECEKDLNVLMPVMKDS